MALTLTREYLPTSVYTGEAVRAVGKPGEDGYYDIAQPFYDFVSGITGKVEEAKTGLKGLWIQFQSWWQYGEKNPFNLLASWVTDKLHLNNFYKLKFAGISLSDWAAEDPIGWAASVGLVVGGAALLSYGIGAAGTAGASAMAGRAAFVAARAGSVAKTAMSVAGRIKSIGMLVGIGGLVRWFVGGVQRIWGFNWNQSDQQIRAAQGQAIKGLAGRWGEALGSAVGTLCGFTLGRAAKANAPRLITFNPTLLAKLQELEYKTWADPGPLWEEAIEEIKSTLTQTARTAAAVVFMEGYVNVRKIVKSAARFTGLSKIFPWIDKWGEPGAEPWSFASAQEKAIDSIKIDWLKDFTEEFVEAAQDMCAESTILVSYAL